jgi:Ca-activated chloride channel family protein
LLFVRSGNNRVILATDGDFNVGVSSTSELVRLVEERRAEGTFLSVLGFGVGNIKDERMEQLADKGNGNYAYIESLLEARKVLVQEMGGTLVTVAKDVKLQVEFNPSRVQAYRLIGYENRLLRNEDFADDTKDASEMGAGHSVTALYEIIPSGIALDVKLDSATKLRYQEQATRSAASSGDELLFVKVRYKEAAGSTNRLMEHAVRDRGSSAGSDLRFALAVAGYGMLLRDSEYKGSLTYEDIAELARGAIGRDPNGYRADFVKMVEKTGSIRVAQR